GFGMGIERVILSLKQQGIEPPALPAPAVQISPLGEAARIPAFQLARTLREAGIGVLVAFGNRSLKAQLKNADKANVAYTLIIGEQELAADAVLTRDMRSHEQQVVARTDIVAWLRQRL
ncbi:MAG: His/Gly/Thr/Pro-type tRNA ligase C-terminal domain-containing protein, partial [Anaerolineae bacterium]|nr:His/Gly/Thr/Pro-type tRNA ligase C-terminal domain-containing protein [Anaerolineae bacterium]